VHRLYQRPEATKGPAQRPSVELCMIATPDGVIDVGGKSGPLGSAADREVMLSLRERADVVLVGAGTVRSEHYGAPRRSPMPIVVVTRSGELDFASPLFQSEWAIVATTTHAPEMPVRTFRAGDTVVDLASIISQLHTELGANIIHVEGGPQLNTALFEADLVDAIHLTFSPLIGAGGPSITQQMSHSQRFVLAYLDREHNHVFARYERER